MTRIGMAQGWLLYAGSLGVVTANVRHADINVQTSTLDVTSAFGPYRQLVRGPVEIMFSAELTEKYHWEKCPVKDEAPDLKALLALARRHPEEYAELREGEAVMRALGG